MTGAEDGRDNDSLPEGEELQPWQQPDDAPVEAERLALDGEERLPWLESDDDDVEESGVDGGRIFGFVLAGLIALVLLVGGIWWASHRETDPALTADGSTIEAPEQPYKEAPKDPGGKTFDGTGDTSFAASEGQNRPARLGENAPPPMAAPSAAAPRPGVDLAPRPSAAAAARPGASAAAAPSAAADVPGIGVQVGAFSTRAAAEAAWTRLSQRHTALSGLRHRVVEGSADIGTVYRLQAVAGDVAAANTLCGSLKSAGLPCQVKR